MRKIIWLAVMIIALPVLAQAQDAPRVEIFGGYSYLRADEDNLERDLHGWNASFATNITKWLGMVGEFSGHYNNQDIFVGTNADFSTHLFLIGPRFSYRGNERVTPFGHVLLGAARSSITYFDVIGRVRISDSAFALAVGGGVDVKVADPIAIRLFQADYVLTRFNDDNQHNLRLSTGVVFRIGEQ